MTSTGTWDYGPAASNLTLTAFGRIGIRRAEITTQHLADALNEANLVQVKLASKQPNLWTSTLYSVTLTASTATYTLPARLIAIQAAFLTVGTGDTATDQILWPLSAFEYSAIPNKTQEAVVNSYWFNRQITPQITLWPVPDDSTTYVLNLRAVYQIEDVSLSSGATLNMPYRWLDVYVAELAYRMARIYAPDKEVLRKADADEAWVVAATEDQERVPLYIQPQTQSYWQ